MSKSKDKFVFFWDGIYSQWYLRDINIDNVVYSCCEQYMMAKKALLFDDNDAYEAIMQAKHPSKQKQLGRAVSNFDKGKWDAVSEYVVNCANFAKFTQHDDLGEQLLATGDKIIAEASPHDCIWGIGLYETDDRATDPSKWRGENKLGVELMKVREAIKEEENAKAVQDN